MLPSLSWSIVRKSARGNDLPSQLVPANPRRHLFTALLLGTLVAGITWTRPLPGIYAEMVIGARRLRIPWTQRDARGATAESPIFTSALAGLSQHVQTLDRNLGDTQDILIGQYIQPA